LFPLHDGGLVTEQVLMVAWNATQPPHTAALLGGVVGWGLSLNKWTEVETPQAEVLGSLTRSARTDDMSSDEPMQELLPGFLLVSR
jgi:hypothetical protein